MGSNKDVVTMHEMVRQLAEAVAKDDEALEIVADKIKALEYQVEYVRKILETPAAILRPRLLKFGESWCALLGDHAENGICGFGNNPIAALADFNDKYRERCERGWKT